MNENMPLFEEDEIDPCQLIDPQGLCPPTEAGSYTLLYVAP